MFGRRKREGGAPYDPDVDGVRAAGLAEEQGAEGDAADRQADRQADRHGAGAGAREVGEVAAGSSGAASDEAADAEPAGRPPGPTTGPFDSSEVNDTLPRLDLGALRVPAVQGLELRVELNAEKQPLAATLVHGTSTMQMMVFAAPRSSGQWPEVLDEIAEGVRRDGGTAQEADGAFGPELRVSMRPADGSAKSPAQRVRFVGVDGPRWFLRATLTGPAATDDAAATPLLDLLRGVVVHRGDQAMAPRDLLPLRLPEAEGTEVDGGARDPSLDPFRRGPEITETR